MAAENVLRKLVLDLICVCAVGLPIPLLFFLATPYQRGFYCNDTSIRYPFKASTVSSLMLYVVGFFMPSFVMGFTEWVHFRRYSHKYRSHEIWRYTIHPFVWQTYKTIGFFGFGCLLSQLMTDCGKYSIGRLRPHFISVCDQNLLAQPCITYANEYQYITNYACTGNADLVREARLSFPSGHSSFSAYTMVYFACYLQARMTWRGARLLKPTLQYVAILLAFLTGLSRVSNYKHHWSDVLVGFLLGGLVAIFVSRCVSDMFTQNMKHSDSIPMISTHEVSANVEDGYREQQSDDNGKKQLPGR